MNETCESKKKELFVEIVSLCCSSCDSVVMLLAGDGGGGGGEHVRVLAAHAPGARAAPPARAQGRARLSHRSVSPITF